MSTRLNAGLADELARYGAPDVRLCFNCGNCTAVCALSEGETAFPRHVIRDVQLGLADRLLASPDPWLCYYCGQCSETCPRDAFPGELMMALRRWLTAHYDRTGISRRLYLSERWQAGLLLLGAALVLLLFLAPADFGFRLLARHPEARATVMLQHFAPTEIVHRADWALAGLLLVLLAGNAARMTSLVMRGTRAPLRAWTSALAELAIHAATQKRWIQCGEAASRLQWLRHIVLVAGYGTLLVLVVLFLPAFQVEIGGGREGSWHWTSLPGYAATAALLGMTLWMALDRWHRRDASHRHSQPSDWWFLGLLHLAALSGIALHVLRMLDLPLATYVVYTAHLMIAVPMLLVEVPFGKWAHLVYRPLAVYLVAVRARAARTRDAAPETRAVEALSH
jgi:ferredoxin